MNELLAERSLQENRSLASIEAAAELIRHRTDRYDEIEAHLFMAISALKFAAIAHKELS